MTGCVGRGRQNHMLKMTGRRAEDVQVPEGIVESIRHCTKTLNCAAKPFPDWYNLEANFSVILGMIIKQLCMCLY